MKLKAKKIYCWALIILLISVGSNFASAQTPIDEPGGEVTGNNTIDNSSPVVPINSNLNFILITSGLLLGYRKLKTCF